MTETAQMASKTTDSSRGGVDFDALCNGAKYYSFNLVELSTATSVEEVERKLIDKLDETMIALESYLPKKRSISKIYIGKTYVKQKKNQRFDSQNHSSWIKEGITARWRDHSKEDYGKDGMVVLGVITRDTLIRCCRNEARATAVRNIHQEDFALAMEQRLIHHFTFNVPVSKLANDTFTTGKLTKTAHIGYVVYMTFSYTSDTGKLMPTEPTNDPQDDRSQQAPSRPLTQDALREHNQATSTST